MKSLILLLALCSATMSFAGNDKYSCELQANHWYNGENMGHFFSKPMSMEECFAKGEFLFDSVVSTGTTLIHVRKNKITERSWTTLYKRVKITHRGEDGFVTKKVLKRDDVEKSEVTKRTYDIRSGWRCWTQGEDCEEIKK